MCICSKFFFAGGGGGIFIEYLYKKKYFFLDPFRNETNEVFNVLGSRCYELGLDNSNNFPNNLFFLFNGTQSSKAYNARLNSEGFFCQADNCFLTVNLSKSFSFIIRIFIKFINFAPFKKRKKLFSMRNSFYIKNFIS